jgi:hypothetical protein
VEVRRSPFQRAAEGAAEEAVEVAHSKVGQLQWKQASETWVQASRFALVEEEEV